MPAKHMEIYYLYLPAEIQGTYVLGMYVQYHAEPIQHLQSNANQNLSLVFAVKYLIWNIFGSLFKKTNKLHTVTNATGYERHGV